jgi:hypothetical protein
LSEHSKVRFEIRLPKFYNDASEIEASKFLETAYELQERFGGWTALSETRGRWKSPENKIYEDVVVGFFVDIDKEKLDETLTFLRIYKGKLKERFRQQEIYVIGYDIYEV